MVRPWSGLRALGVAKMKTDMGNTNTFTSTAWDKFSLEHAAKALLKKLPGLLCPTSMIYCNVTVYIDGIA